MAHIFRPAYQRRVPASAEIITRGGQRFAILTYRGRQREALITTTAAGDRIISESAYFHGEWIDARGRRRRRKLAKDRKSADQMLARIVRQVERARAGLELPEEETAAIARPLTEWLDDYARKLGAEGRTAKHIERARSMIDALLRDLGFVTFLDLQARAILHWCAEQRPRLSSATLRGYCVMVKAFSAHIARACKLSNPLVDLQPPEDSGERRRERRVLTAAEFDELIEATRRSRFIRCGMNGRQRAALYLTAAYTGLRAGELASLTAGNFVESPDGLIVRLAGESAKSRRAAELPIPDSIAPAIRAHLGELHQLSGALWPGIGGKTYATGRMLQGDLGSTRIPYVDESGRVFDFHSLRGMYVTSLIRAGVPMAVVQRLARHASITTTAKHYARIDQDDLRAAVESLPAPADQQKKPPKR